MAKLMAIIETDDKKAQSRLGNRTAIAKVATEEGVIDTEVFINDGRPYATVTLRPWHYNSDKTRTTVTVIWRGYINPGYDGEEENE